MRSAAKKSPCGRWTGKSVRPHINFPTQARVAVPRCVIPCPSQKHFPDFHKHDTSVTAEPLPRAAISAYSELEISRTLRAEFSYLSYGFTANLWAGCGGSCPAGWGVCVAAAQAEDGGRH